MKMATIQTIGVIGAGTMGNGIAHVAARSGFKVLLHDVDRRFLDRAISTITKNLDREVAKGKISADDKSSALSRIVPAAAQAALAEADFVIEAVIEELDTKSKVFQAVDEVARPSVILASKHIFDIDHEDRFEDKAAGQGDRYAFYESGSDDDAGRSCARLGHF